MMTEKRPPVSVINRPVWLGPEDRPLLGWTSVAEAVPRLGSVLVLPPIGYDYWSSHRTLRVLAEALAAEGFAVLRLDYDGTGDSSGDQWEDRQLARWRGSVASGAAFLRQEFGGQLTVVGARLGALLALSEGPALDVERIVAWMPEASGARVVRELRLIGQPFTLSEDRAGLSFAGSIFSDETLTDLRGVDLLQLADAPAPRVLIVEQTETQKGRLANHLRALGAAVDVALVRDASEVFHCAAEDAVVPHATIAAIRSWLVPATAPAAPAPAVSVTGSSVQVVPWGTGAVREQVVRLGPRGLIGVRADAAGPVTHDDVDERIIVVFLNSGSESHIGPGRAWVEFARSLSRSGVRTLRLDFSGWGESSDAATAPGRPYDQHVLAECEEVTRLLEAEGHRVVLVGLCAGAWVAFAAAGAQPPAGLVAINPQLYWRVGDRVEALISDTHERRTAERLRHHRGHRAGLWWLLDRIGFRPPAGRGLDELTRAGVPALLIFSEGDDGLTYLRERIGGAWARFCAKQAVAEQVRMDHAMHAPDQRDTVLELIRTFVSDLPADR